MISSFKQLWSEKMLDTISIFLNLLWVILCPLVVYFKNHHLHFVKLTGYFFLPCLPNHCCNHLLHLSYYLFILVYHLFQILHSLFLTGPFLWPMSFFMLLSILTIITLNCLCDTLFASISSSSSYGEIACSFIWGSISLSSHFVFVSMY